MAKVSSGPLIVYYSRIPAKPSKFLENLFLSKNEKKRSFVDKNERTTNKVYFVNLATDKEGQKHSFWLLFLAFKVRLQENNIIQGGITH